MSAIHYLPTPARALDRFKSFEAVLPIQVAQARRGFGGFITLDLGSARAADAVTNEAQFEWHLWVYMCDWDLHKNGVRILWRRESDNALAGAILKQLEGEMLESIKYDEADDCFELSFSGGYHLNIDPDFYGFSGEDDLFMLFEHGQPDCLSYSPEKRFYQAA